MHIYIHTHVITYVYACDYMRRFRYRLQQICNVETQQQWNLLEKEV